MQSNALERSVRIAAQKNCFLSRKSLIFSVIAEVT